MKKKQFLWLMIAIGILSTGSGCDTVKPVSTTQEIPTAEETNLVTTAPVSEGEQPAETTTVPQIADVLTTADTHRCSGKNLSATGKIRGGSATDWLFRPCSSSYL